MRRLHLITPLLLGFAIAAPAPTAHAQVAVGLSITIAPPILPVYVQPPIPGPGYIWTPGYWAWGPDGYYWVPGTWVLPPAVGLLWTPGYWGWNDGVYLWNAGYWGPTVGFYGGINYGFGYTGDGYWGGRWDHGHFAYNREVNNFGGTHITNVYSRTVINNTTINRVAYNGGTGGVTAHPTAQQEAFAHEHHVAPTALQVQHQQTAAGNPALRASVNHGAPTVAATSRPNQFTGRGVVAAHPATTPAATTAPIRPGGAPGPAIGQPGAAPTLHGPTLPTTAHPAVITPGTQVQHPVAPPTPGTATPGAAHPAVLGTPVQPVTPAHPVAPAVQHPAVTPGAVAPPRPATPAPRPATPAYHPTPAPAYHPAPAPAYHPAPAPAPHPAPAPAPHPAPSPHSTQDKQHNP